MKIPEEAVCSVCEQVFCCKKCCEKHAIKNHSRAIFIRRKRTIEDGEEQLVESFYVICPICINKPLPLHDFIYPEMLKHLCEHLPLYCQKCLKVYEKGNDLRKFSLCTRHSNSQNKKEAIFTDLDLESSCVLKRAIQSLTFQQNTISTQTTPRLENQFSITPISVVNFEWKARTLKAAHYQDITDSISSIKNLSSITSSTSQRQSLGSVNQIEARGNLVRTTSTPLHTHTKTENVNPKQQTFNASDGQVSVIVNNCDAENSTSPGVVANFGNENQHRSQPEAVNIYKKFNSRTKIAAVTPLRQVMSKSIQKALTEHGLPSEQSGRELSKENLNAFSSSPLDLRLSPALRRCQGYSFNIPSHNQIDTASKENFPKCIPVNFKKQPESITIRHSRHHLSCYQSTSEHQSNLSIKSCSATSLLSMSANSIYKTCQGFEVFTSTDVSVSAFENKNFDLLSKNVSEPIVPITPITRLTGNFINKKAIKFDTPKNCTKILVNANATLEKFYTPNSSPKPIEDVNPNDTLSTSNAGFSPSCRRSIRKYSEIKAKYKNEIDVSSDDEVFQNKTEETHSNQHQPQQHRSSGIIKTLVNAVWQFPSLNEKSNVIEPRPGIHAKNSDKTSIIKRCASIAGSIVRSTSLMDEKQLQTLKRKRTHTFDSQRISIKSTCQHESISSLDVSDANDLSTKRFRIQARKPIERMRKSNS